MEERKGGIMVTERKPMQGLLNVLRFNWHYYFIAICVLLCLIILSEFLDAQWQWYVKSFAILMAVVMTIPLVITYYIYDYSNLYELEWLADLTNYNDPMVLNVNAGFDETSQIISKKFGVSNLDICDFYNPKDHTEVSIKRARAAYPPDPRTVKVTTNSLPYPVDHFDVACVTFAAHEIRDYEERKAFFNELSRVVKPNGRIYVTEHMRDTYNFLAYNIGCFHFYSRSSWLKVFQSSQLNLFGEHQTTVFVRTFALTKDGAAH